MANVSRKTKAGQDVAIIAALRKGVLGLDQIALAGTVYTQSGAADLVQGRIAAGATLLQAKAAWEAAIATDEAVDKHVDRAVRDLRNAVIASGGEDGPHMAEFQFKARKKRVFTQEQMDAIVAKRNATRIERGTKGRKQKKDIKGVVPSEVGGVAPPAVVLPVAQATVPAATPEGNVSPVDALPQGEPGNKSGE